MATPPAELAQIRSVSSETPRWGRRKISLGRVDRFERRLQGLVGDAFARVFGGSVVPQEVVQALFRGAEGRVEELAGGRRLAPNRFTVLLSPTDLARMGGDRAEIVNSLSSCV